LGRIKTVFIKHLTNRVLERHRDKFTTNFDKNKEILDQVIEINSKKLRNQVAGYITKIMKRE